MPAMRTLLLLLSISLLTACGTSVNVVSSSTGPTIDEALAAPSVGVRKRVAVSNFESGSAPGKLGGGLTDMLSDALFNTNRFIVLERDRLDEVMREQELTQTSRFDSATRAPLGELEGAELIIKGSVVKFEEQCRGASLLLLSAKEACIGLNLRIIDVATGRVVNSTTVEGRSSTTGVGLVFTTSPLPIGLGGWAKTPVEEALRQAIEAGVRFIVTQRL